MAGTSELPDQSQKIDSPESQPDFKPTKTGVFIKRAEGQSFEEFKEFCIKRFSEAGLIK